LVVFARLARKCNLRSLGGIYACSSRRLFCSVPLAKAICAFDKDNQRLAQTLGTPRPKIKEQENNLPCNTCHAPFCGALEQLPFLGFLGALGIRGFEDMGLWR